jgi:hypothetical protein
MDPADLERLVDRELRALPPPRAPRTLLPRVMAAVEEAAAEQPWYARTWLTWPVGWQIASLVFLFSAIAGAAILWPTVEAAINTLSFVTEVRGDVASTARDVETATTALRVLWRTLLAPVVPYAFALVLLMCAACAIFGTALNHLVFGKALR